MVEQFLQVLSFRHLGANEADAMEKKRKSKLNPDEGFSSFENATFRKYGRLTAQIKPDMEVYADNKEKAGEAFYATVGTVVHGVHKVRDRVPIIDCVTYHFKT